MTVFQIAVLLTCHNRRKKTIVALKSLMKAEDYYNKCGPQKIELHFFLTDDGCSDDTASASINLLKERITIIKTDGNSYWAGGMISAWRAALNTGFQWEFFLLINDDVEFFPTMFNDLFETHFYSYNLTGKNGVYTGFICDKNNPLKVLYGAKEYPKSWLSKSYHLQPTGIPQECKITNANLLLVSKDVVEKVGILFDGYIHGGADWDYGITASNAGFPVFTTHGFCGSCENDHITDSQEKDLVTKMSFRERKKYLLKPTKEYKDTLLFLKRNYPSKLFIAKLAFILNLVFPRVYYYLNDIR